MTSVYQGPIPTRLVALSKLFIFPVGEKVRFLGCVVRYDIACATITLEHNFPSGSNNKALVDIRLVLETLQSTDTRVGEWVNVIGYITMPPPKQNHNETKNLVTSLQAIVLWSAGSVKLDEYETFLTDQLDTN